MKVGLLGFDFESSNKGCEALSYSFINMLQEICVNDLDVHVFGYSTLGLFPNHYPNIKFSYHRLKLKNPKYIRHLYHDFSDMDYVFDITFGDGFSDIYGKRWNAITDLAKEIANRSRAPLILLPQTYGPYYHLILRKWAYRIIKHSNMAFSRDQKSAEEVNRVLKHKVIAVTDLAFALPYDKQMFTMKSNRKLGLNVSSLLWDGGHNIQLKTDYQKYCSEIVQCAPELGFDEVHLIAHVIDTEHPEVLENDYRVCELLHERFPQTVLAPPFETPIEAKSYISNMDVFIGARMHSTIASFSTGVCTIPFAYSKKFEGLFGNLDYKYIIEGRQLSTSEACELTKKYIMEVDQLKASQMNSMAIVRASLDEFKTALSATITGKDKC